VRCRRLELENVLVCINELGRTVTREEIEALQAKDPSLLTSVVAQNTANTLPVCKPLGEVPLALLLVTVFFVFQTDRVDL
jgi:hypothetical protein